MTQLATKIISIATETPPKAYSQTDMLRRLNITDPRVARLFLSTHIEKRYLYLPESEESLDEPQKVLLDKHLNCSLQIGKSAILKALTTANLSLDDIKYLCVVTSTGFLVPTLSAYFIKELNIPDDCRRVDIVGMGCNAGLNGLNTVHNWTLANPDCNGVLLCVEICSAAYVNNGSLRTNVVNSLFGDGAAAVVIRADQQEPNGKLLPKILGFSSCIITDAIDAMRYDWDEDANKFSFFLHHSNPYLVGKAIEKPVQSLLKRFNLRIDQINHWIIHGGGKNVISAVKFNLGITAHDMRHTSSVLRDYGNLSSGSFLFSFERLQNEKVVVPGDYGILITIGPGAQLEAALIQW